MRQLRGIIDDYVNGVPMSKKKQLLKAQNEGRGIGVGVVNSRMLYSMGKVAKKVGKGQVLRLRARW